MSQVAGEIADSIRPHPVCTADDIEHVMLPAARRGAARSGRHLDTFAVSIQTLIATAPDDTALETKVGTGPNEPGRPRHDEGSTRRQGGASANR